MSKDKKALYDPKFVVENKEKIVDASLSNAKRLLAEGKLLLDNQRYSRATHLLISGFEELAKALMVSRISSGSKGSLSALVNHEQKLEKLLEFIDDNLSKEYPEYKDAWSDPKIRTSLESLRKKRSARLSRVLQETMYVRLVEAEGGEVEPNDSDWRDEAVLSHLLLEYRLKWAEKFLKGV